MGLQAYPQAQGSETDLLVTNEVAAHSSLQLLPGAVPLPGSANIAQLLGTVDAASGGQVRAFQDLLSASAPQKLLQIQVTVNSLR